MNFSIQCQEQGCRRMVRLPARVWKCASHRKIDRIKIECARRLASGEAKAAQS